jgi:hypothetical protein
MKRGSLLQMSFFFAAAIGAAAAGSGCATERTGFRPAVPSTSEAGFPASRYSIPSEAPRGEVFVTSFGTREVEEAGNAHSQLIHVRVGIANQTGSAAWSFEPGQQFLMAPGAAPQPPSFLEIDGHNPGDAHVAPAQKKVFDLYYRMPAGGGAAAPGFDINWQVVAEGKTISERTSFVREPYRDYSQATQHYWADGVASPWWISWYGAPWLGWYGPWGPGPYFGGFYGYGYPYGYRYGYYGNRYGSGFGRGGYGGPRGGGYSGGYSGGRGGLRAAPAVRGRGGR